MTTSTQQIPSNPALDFAQSILEVTNNGLELIEILRDIANDCDEKATTNDRIAAANILTDRAFGKCPKQVSPSQAQPPKPVTTTAGRFPKRPPPSPKTDPSPPGWSHRSTTPCMTPSAPLPAPTLHHVIPVQRGGNPES